jgi:hypothetical protein
MEREAKTFNELNKSFEENLKRANSYRDAYERAEADFEARYGYRRYANYDSFRRCKYYYKKK